MSADLLREAAAKMRERAEAAPAGSPWGVIGGSPVPGAISRDFRVVDNSHSGISMAVCDAYPSGGSNHQRAMAEHIASWHPAVALAVADWLDESAEHLEIHEDDDIPDGLREAICPTALEGPDCSVLGQAVAVARAYLGRDA